MKLLLKPFCASIFQDEPIAQIRDFFVFRPQTPPPTQKKKRNSRIISQTFQSPSHPSIHHVSSWPRWGLSPHRSRRCGLRCPGSSSSRSVAPGVSSRFFFFGAFIFCWIFLGFWLLREFGVFLFFCFRFSVVVSVRFHGCSFGSFGFLRCFFPVVFPFAWGLPVGLVW